MIDLPRFLSRRPRSRRRRAACLPVEVLETRTLLAGNVAASIEDGTLALQGDAAANSLELMVEGMDIVVRGRDGTTINGSSADFVVQAGSLQFDGDVNVALGAGADTFLITGPLTLGGNVSSRDLLGAGQFAVTDATIEGDVEVRSGRGTDTVSLLNASIDGGLSLALDDGRAFVIVDSSTVAGPMSVRTGDRNDVILLDGSSVGGLHAETGSWIDDIILRSSTIDGDFYAATGSGRDFVLIEDSSVAGDTDLWLWGDSDLIVTQGTVGFDGDFFAGGILGRSDTIELSEGTTIGGQTAIRAFEHHSLSNLGGVNARIGRRLNEAMTFQVPLNGLEVEPLTLTVDTSSNPDVVQSNNTLITKADTFVITGTTFPGATVDVAAGAGGAIDLGSVVAGNDGTYSITVDLLTGPTSVMVTATDFLDRMTSQQFNLHVAVGTVVRFQSSQGSFDVELKDAEAPKTVANFLNYADRYKDSIVHRSAVTTASDPFVIQGGGFVLDSSDELQKIVTDPAVMSEFSGNSNVRGTLAMALTANLSGTDPNSGTSQWFVNLKDNSQLDAQMFTVFGEIIGDGLAVADDIAALQRVNLNEIIPAGMGALSEVPLDGYMLQAVQLTGTVSVASGSIQVNGTGTLFTTELKVNDVITIQGQPYRVIQINSDTQMLVDSSQAMPIVNSTYFTEPKATSIPTRDQYVVFDSIAVLL